jgi:RNA polymerase sigma-70 factor, ECF subfamily
MSAKDMEHPFEDERRTIFVELLTQHQRKLYSYIYSLIPNGADSDDLLQETNLVLWKKAKEYKFGTSFMAWACQIAFFNVQKFLTTKGRTRVYFNEKLLSQLAELHMDHADSHTIYSMLLISCLERLSEGSKLLLKLRYDRNHSMQEIAGQLNRPIASLYNSLSHIRFKIMKCIKYALKDESIT